MVRAIHGNGRRPGPQSGQDHIAPIGTYGAASPKGKGLSPFGASAGRTVAQRRKSCPRATFSWRKLVLVGAVYGV